MILICYVYIIDARLENELGKDIYRRKVKWKTSLLAHQPTEGGYSDMPLV